MKSYAEFLRGYISKNGSLIDSTPGGYCIFYIQDKGDEKLVDVGIDYAEFSGNRHILIPLNLLVVRIK